MKIKSLLGTLALSLGLLASPAAAEKFVVGFQPYDTISYQAIVNAELGLWKKYPPAGTEIEFQPALQGTVVANNMLANKAQVGYMSVMPATILCSKPKQAEIKMVATLGMSKGTRCSLVVVRKDAPEFKSNEEVARWLDGKIIAAPKGSAWKKNVIFALVVLALAAGIFLAVRAQHPAKGSGLQAVVDFGDGVTETLPLAQDHDYLYEVGDYIVHLQVKDGAIAFLDSQCPDHVCEQFGWLDKDGAWAACVPAGVYVVVEPTADAE